MPYKDKGRQKQYAAGYWKNYYSDPIRKARHLVSVRKHERNRRIRIRIFLNEYKVSRGCNICGFDKHPAALDFHHRIQKDKLFSVASWKLRTSNANLLAEIEKCDILCANCHRIKHFEELNGDVA